VGSLALLFSFSRGGWLAFAVAVVVLLVGLVRGRYVGVRGPVVAFFIATLIAVLFYPQIVARFGSEEGSAAALDRVYLIKIAWNMIKESPIIGVGANTFMSVVTKYARGPELQDIYLHMVHNQYLLVFAETGIVGMAAFLWFLFTCFREAWKCLKSKGSELTQMIGLSVTAAFIGMTIHMMVDMFASRMCLSFLFVLCSLCSASRKVEAAGEAAEVAEEGVVVPGVTPLVS
jgi:O-antigen ligase